VPQAGVSFFRGVVEQQGLVCEFYGGHQVLKATQVAPPHIPFRHIVAARQNAVSDSYEIDLDVVRANVDQHNLVASPPRVDHHAQVALPGNCGLDGKAFRTRWMLICGFQNLPSGSDGKRNVHGRLESVSNRVRIEDGNFSEKAGGPTG
jgi:hypothetical protein